MCADTFIQCVFIVCGTPIAVRFASLELMPPNAPSHKITSHISPVTGGYYHLNYLSGGGYFTQMTRKGVEWRDPRYLPDTLYVNFGGDEYPDARRFRRFFELSIVKFDQSS